MIASRLLQSLIISCALFQSIIYADAWDEVCEWRRRAGLPQMKEDPALTKFAMMKARYRAERGLKDGHQGPKCPKGCTEGTGEAKPSWGILTCLLETDAQTGGAGLCIGRDGERYMVLVVRGHTKHLINPNKIPVFNTSYLTPNPPSIKK